MTLYAGIHIQGVSSSEFTLNNIDFEKNVHYLKKEIADKLLKQTSLEEIELIYNGIALDDDVAINSVMKPNGLVHIFKKAKQYEPSSSNVKPSCNHVQDLFNLIAHIQINVNSRVNILQKILAEYPDFRRNLAAQALIRDSVLFNTLYQPEVVKAIAENYPIICEAAPFIVDTIKKELKTTTQGAATSSNNLSEPTDSTNSSEEENSLGANSSDRSLNQTSSVENQSENARIRQISRQQLQAALAQIGFGSVNSLSNIAQRNNESTQNSSGTSNSGERITSEMFRNELERALRASEAEASTQRMDTSEPTAVQEDAGMVPSSAENTSDDGSDDIPASYRSHQYADQLRQLAQMGFLNHDMNVRYLNISNGNIEHAIGLLMALN